MSTNNIDNQLIHLLTISKDIDSSELQTNTNLIICAIKKFDDRKKNKKIYNISLCDNIYKFTGFIIADHLNSTTLKKGDLINIQKIIPKKVKAGFYIIIRDYNIIENNLISLSTTSTLKEKNGNFLDEAGNIIIRNNSCPILSDYFSDDDLEEVVYTPLKQLTTFSRDFVILVRILKKSEIKFFETRNNNNSNNGSQGKLFYFMVLDKEDNEMQCTCFNKAADKFFNLIQEDKLYEIRGGYVKINDRKFSRNKSDYKIVLEENSIIKRKSDNGLIKKRLINIVYIKDIQSMKLYSIIDLCVIVLDVGETVIKNTRNGNQNLKKILVGDISKYKIELSLWRIHSQIDVKIGDYLILHNVKVGEFKGRNISTYDDTSISKIDPIISENSYIKELYDLITNKKYKLTDFLELENLNELRAQKIRELEESTFSTVHIRDVLEYLDDIDEVSNISKICATVTQIMHNEKNFYAGCQDKNCKRKLNIDNNGGFICPNCGRKTNIPTYYYTLSLRVKDASCEQWIDIFGKPAEGIMEYSAEEYMNILKNKESIKLKEISDRIEFKSFNFWVKPKLQMYNTVSKKKLYAYRIELVNKRNESHKLVKYLLNELM